MSVCSHTQQSAPKHPSDPSGTSCAKCGHPISWHGEDTSVFIRALKNQITSLKAENKELREANDVWQKQAKEQTAEAYGRGVSAGKLEALGYSEREKKAYLNVVSYSEGYQDAKRLFDNN
jgi:hypothetical protein